MRKLILFFFVLFPVLILAQEAFPVEIKGKVLADFGDLDGIYVINLKTEKTVITDKEGVFLVPAAVGDTLLCVPCMSRTHAVIFDKDSKIQILN